ncbi:LCP family protein [Arthrobacter sp. zg-Y1171]|uniref:LCP family protein n=1 Tax=Arthrobacter sp. zg-Y1171 TaxID=2964610 RepID=UPI0021080838|nr:LCP family protein [Arthrobacter sp. zg-Y1171]MCQ1995139.1 LCP family protein [Arthrobacter sp. zg-Y1171]UWX80814.1 LCP family protein [Arthrobacter sp. zg-Y1171]
MSEYPFSPETDVPADTTRRKSHRVRNVLLVFVALVLVAALAAGGYLWHLARTFDSSTDTIANALPETRPEKGAAAGDSQNILLMGSDTRDPASGDARSDTMMLVHIPGDRSGVYVMSIMRDTWVEIPGHGEHKINAAMALGGVSLTVDTVQTLFDVPIDHVAIIDFEGFQGLTDALGGVTLNNDIAFQSEGGHGEYFAAGPITVEGESALKYVRERYAFADGDYQRVKNQQAFLSGVISGVLNTETLTDPVKVSNIVGEISPYLSVDEDLDAAAAGALAVSLRNVRSGDVHMFTLPNAGVGTSSDGQSIVVPDEAAIAEIGAALDADDLAGYLRSAVPQG